MKEISVFFRWFLIPLFALLFGFGLCNARNFNTFQIIIFSLMEIISIVYMFNSFSYSNECIEKKFLKRKTVYYLKDIILVRKSSIGFYDFFSNDVNLPRLGMNFLFQRKALLDLVDYIKKANPSCVFEIDS